MLVGFGQEAAIHGKEPQLEQLKRFRGEIGQVEVSREELDEVKAELERSEDFVGS